MDQERGDLMNASGVPEGEGGPECSLGSVTFKGTVLTPLSIAC